MPFSREIRESALVAAARHCCVCRRYKGVKLEVHHLVPEADGGPNNIENAIVLCFDCHTDAGHYNPRHPRGTKYSRNELMRARDEWFRRVQQGGVEAAVEPSPVHVRYLICRAFEIIVEICSGDLARVPAERPFLVRTPMLDFMSSVVRTQATQYRPGQVYGDGYSSVDDYRSAFPDARRTSKSNPSEAYYELTREPAAADILRIANEDGVSRLLNEQGVPPGEIARTFAYEEVCGGAVVQEVHRLRPLWGVFLAATNVSNAPVVLEEVTGAYASDDQVLYRPLHEPPEANGTISLPRAPLPSGATALVPIATVLAPYHAVAEDPIYTDHEYLALAYVQTVSRVHLLEDPAALTNTWGPVLRPEALTISAPDGSQRLEVHDLDLKNVYVVDRAWEMGSCPHLFALTRNREAIYVGELLAQHPGTWHVDTAELPEGTSEIVIAELEEEITELIRVEQDGVILAEHSTLEKGMALLLPAHSSHQLLVEGRYRTISGDLGIRNPSRRADLVGTALRRLTSELRVAADATLTQSFTAVIRPNNGLQGMEGGS